MSRTIHIQLYVYGTYSVVHEVFSVGHCYATSFLRFQNYDMRIFFTNAIMWQTMPKYAKWLFMALFSFIGAVLVL